MFLDDIVGPLTIEEAKSRRMSAQMKLSRAWDREQQKSAASRERAKELLNPTKPEQTKPTQNEIKQRLDAKCWTGKHKEGTKIKGGVRVNNCVPNEAANPAQQAAIAIAKKKEQGVAEMDGDGAGRDGSNRKSHSTYGSRDKHNIPNGPDIHLGAKHTMKPKDITKRADDVLNKEFDKAHKKGVAEGLDDDNVQGAIIDTVERLFRKNNINDYGALEAIRQGVKHHLSKPGATADSAVEGILNILDKRMRKSGNYLDLSRFKEALRQGIDHQLKKQGVAEGDREFRNQERNAGLEPEDNGTYSIWTQGSKDDKPKSIITKQCSMDDAERHARSIKKKYPFLKVWMQAHHLGKGGFFPMNEDSWSDGQGEWTSQHDQWTKESVEQTDTSEEVYGAIIRRIIGAHASLLGQYGPDRVMAAARDVADWNNDVEEIGTSDVSGWVRQVFQKLQNNEY